MNDLTPLEGPFDLWVSSLAVHYIEDFDTLLRQIHRLLTPGGTFVFSQEHPFTTALMREPRWTRDGEGRILHYNLDRLQPARRKDDQLDCRGSREIPPPVFGDFQFPRPGRIYAGAGTRAGSGRGGDGRLAGVSEKHPQTGFSPGQGRKDITQGLRLSAAAIKIEGASDGKPPL